MPISGLRRFAAALALAGFVTGVHPLQAQDAPAAAVTPGNSAGPDDSTVVPPEELERIRERLGREPALDLEPGRMTFYSQVVGRQAMTFSEYARGSDLMNGPVRRGNPMTHREFIDMVTPRDLYSSGGITATDLLQFALTNYIGKRVLQLGLDELRQARDEKEAREIRDRIERELTILKAAEGRLR